MEIKKEEQLYKGEKEAMKTRILNLEEELRSEKKKNREELEKLTRDLKSSLNENSLLKASFGELLESVDTRIRENADSVWIQVLQNKSEIQAQKCLLYIKEFSIYVS